MRDNLQNRAHSFGKRWHEAQQSAPSLRLLCPPDISLESHRDTFSQQHRDSIADHLDSFTLGPDKHKVIRKGLKPRALSDSQRPVFRRVDKIPQGTTRNRLGWFIRRQAAQPCGRTTTTFCRGSVHDAPKGSPSVTLVPELFRKVAHSLARLQQFSSLPVFFIEG